MCVMVKRFQRLRRLGLLFLLVCGVLQARPAQAQTGAIVSQTLEIFAAGVDVVTGVALRTVVIPIASMTCNQTLPIVSPVTVNPGRASWPDLVNLGKACISDQSIMLAGLPLASNYVATSRATDDFGLVSPRSAASNPFTRRDPPSAPTGLLIVR